MFSRGLLKTSFAAIFLLATAAYADDKSAASETKTETKTETVAPRGRLTKPFSEIKDLTPEQTAKIKEIHSKYLAQINELRGKDKEESMAVLSDDQKKQVAEVTAKAGADRKAAAAKKKEAASESK
jgi:Spy/CpxP family protein refolding chaperone